MSAEESKDQDARIQWIEDRVRSVYRHLKEDKFSKAWTDADTQSKIEAFLDESTIQVLAFYSDSITAAHGIPKRLPRGKVVYFLKFEAVPVKKDNPGEMLSFHDLSTDALLHLERVVRDVYLPLLTNPANQKGWGEVTSKEMMDKLYTFLAQVAIAVGHTRGETTLPLPPLESDAAAETLAPKDRVHLLEGAVITWTKQIKNVLKLDPESALKAGQHPTPEVEIKFWRTKAANLNAIFDQLQSDRIRRVLQFLDESRSTYCTPFAKLCREVFASRAEANDNVKYLRTLDDWFEKLNNPADFEQLDELFRPILHIILLIWKNSRYYNTPARLVVLIREICNAIIQQAFEFVNGRMVFEHIDEDEETQAIKKLRKTLQVCGAFKDTYADYKATANAECPTNPWRIQNNALFLRLDAFIERCHDVLEMTEIVVKFKKLEKIVIGGTKGGTLSHNVQAIYQDFQRTVATFQEVDYDILDVEETRFDDDYYSFRSSIKGLERRLSSLLTQGFEDQPTVAGRFKILDSFDTLLERPIIQDELERKHISLVQQYGDDLKRVQEIFLTERDDPPIPHNMPPIAGALTWSRSLKERIMLPMAKIRELGRAVMEREEAKEVTKVYSTIMASLDDYEQARIEEWGSDMEANSEAKLRLPLLRRGKDDPQDDVDERLLFVNFDPALVRLLREVKYFLLLDLEVPAAALNVYKGAKTFRKQTGALELIVGMYNQMMQEMLPVEAPLMRQQINKIDQTMRRGLRDLNWKSDGIDTFIQDSQALVREAHGTLFDLKRNLDRIAEILDGWTSTPILQRKAKPMPPDEFENMFRSMRTSRYASIKQDGSEIEKKLKESHSIMSVSKTHPHWVAYTDFVNGIVVQGLARMVKVSLEYLAEQLDSEFIRRQQMQPMLILRLDLLNQDAVFKPSIEEETEETSIFSIVNGWVDSFYHAAAQVRRLDDGDGKFVREMMGDMEVQMLLASINERLLESADHCAQLREQYLTYEWLWKDDMRTSFEAFRKEAVIQIEAAQGNGEGEAAEQKDESKDDEDADASGDQDEVRVETLVLPDISRFDQEVSRFEGIQDEVSRMPSPSNLGWLRVNSEPLKLAISNCIAQWSATFTDYMARFVVDELTELRDFMERVNKGLDEEVPEEDKDAETLKRVMGHIRDVNKCMLRRQAMFSPLKNALSMLKSHGVAVDDLKIGEEKAAEYLEEAPIKWDDTKTKTFQKKEEIFPLQTAETVHVKQRVEQFFHSMRDFRNDFRKNAPFAFEGAPEEAYEMMDSYYGNLIQFEHDAAELNELEELFELPISRFNEFTDTRKELRLLKTLWDFQYTVTASYDTWQQTLWSQVDTEDLQERNKKIREYLKKLGDREQIVKAWSVYRNIEQQIKAMSDTLPLIDALHSDDMRQRHWDRLADICGVRRLDPADPNFSLEMIFDLKLHEHAVDVMDVVETAEKQAKIEKKLNKIEEIWSQMNVDFVQHKDTEVRLVRPSEELLEQLENDQMELQSIKGMGKFADFFVDRVERWDTNLQEMDEVLRVWSNVTKSWADLEVIFMESEDIQLSLPEDTKRFSGIDTEFKELMKAAVETPNAIESCTKEGRKDALRGMMQGLELCQKSLKDYLDMKKKKFPRFYFMSADALLTTLSNGSNPPKVVPFLGDCFDSISDLAFEDPVEEGAVPSVATAMTAKDGEMIEFHSPFVARGAVENWLNDLNKKQQATLRYILHEAQESAVNWEVETEKPRHLWLDDFPAQIVLSAAQIFWTEESERALEEYENGQEDAVKKYLQVCNDRLMALIQRVLGHLEPALRIKVISLITLDVHARDVVQKLIDQKAEGPMSFLWQQQLRFYWIPETHDVLIHITDFRTKFTYEWIGNSGRLVITPLTDRCYITLTMALRLMLGGAPAGPAGTGKTETVKDLARALALPCYVFNCSDQMNYQGLADIFKGLAQVGAWGCFDEFNRISIEVLSVVATQVKSVIDAIKLYSVPANRAEEYRDAPAGSPPEEVGVFELNGDPVTLVPTVGLFITMNPGYAGRTELPENLKALFRSCAMIRPDLALICENMLMSEGFQNARPLSIKMVTLYQLSSELLSPQKHYDWGLRAVKSVLRVAGALKRAEPDVEEDAVLMRALRDFNTPKMPLADLPIFRRLVQDLFPNHYNISPKFDTTVEQGAMQACREHGLQPDPDFVKKVVEFKELLDVRHSVMLLGQAGCGKSTVWRMLIGHFNLGHTRNKPAMYEVVNPKAVSSDELYGYMTLAKDWKDGCLSVIMRGMSRNMRDLGYHPYQEHKWVVLDGDIDANWIESMNTVMDDNKVLTLVSNERVYLTPPMRMVFEIDSLANATPATVSRAGILFINESDVGWRPYVDSWIQKRTRDNERAHLPGFFDKYIEPLAEEMRRGYATATPIVLINQAISVCRYMGAFLEEVPDDAGVEVFEHLFVEAVMWAFGGSLIVEKQSGAAGEHRKRFHAILEELAKPNVKFPKAYEGNEDALCFDFYYDVKQGEFRPWRARVANYVHVPIGSGPDEVSFSSLQVETVDSVRIQGQLNRLVLHGHPVMLVGTAGTGKSSLLKSYLQNGLPEHMLHKVINMNYFMDSSALQQQLDSAIDKRSGRSYGPPTGKKVVYLIDDINLPYVETYGTQNSLSLLRQCIDHGQYYDREDLSLRKEIQDVQFVAAMNPTSGSFSISARLQRFFTVFSTLVPSAGDLSLIYQSILEGHLQSFPSAVQQLAEPITNATVALLERVSSFFLPSAKTFIYNWNMRELSNVYQGITLSRHDFFPTPVKLVRLWLHECNRVFSDRLVSEDDKDKFDKMLHDVTREQFKDIPEEELYAEPLIFTSFAAQPGGEPAYLPLPEGARGMEILSNTLTDKLKEYNESKSIMDLVLFEEAMKHVCRISRIINNPSGHAMLIGVGGSGKQSLSRLAAFISDMETVQLSVTSRFTENDLKEALQVVLRDAGAKDVGQIFLMTDSQIVNDKFLVYINELLTSCWIPDLFEREEVDGMVSAVRNEAKAAGVVDTPEAMFEYFLGRIRKNLHLVLCFSPVGDTFRVRARRFPGLINCTSIDQFMPWPRDALVSVANRFLGDLDLQSDEIKEQLAAHMAEVHLAVTERSERFLEQQRRFNYVTPKSFLELISFYSHLLGDKRADSARDIKRLEDGLSKLLQTSKDVAELQRELEFKMERVKEKVEDTDKLLEQMAAERSDAEKQEEEASRIADHAQSESDRATKIKSEADEELAEAKPAMDAAAESVNCLDKDSLNTLKSLGQPPPAVVDVTAAVLLMVYGEIRDHSWKRAQKMMKNVFQFLDDLRTFAAEKAQEIPEDTIERLQRFLELDHFNAESIKGKSSAAANLCGFVVNCVRYNRIYVRVKPLMDAAAAAKEEMDAANAEKAEAEANVAEVRARLQELEDTLAEKTREKEEVEAEAQSCQDRLGLANRLVNGLSSEKERWGSEVESLKEEETRLIGNVMLASAFVSYLGAFDYTFRNALWQDVWIQDIRDRAIPLSDEVDPLHVLADEGHMARMMGEGLPSDRISIENGAIITQCKRWPLMIDPQLQGIKWLRKREEPHGLKVIQLTQNKWVNELCRCITNGIPVIMENCDEELDATLDPVLSRSVIQKGRSFFLNMGGEEVEYDFNFRLYLQTKLSNPHYRPEIQAQCTLINFIATEEGLKDQLLAQVVNKEKPQLEERKQALQRQFNDFKVQLLELEDDLLNRLANAPDDILSDVSLIEGLEQTKEKATEIQAAVQDGRKTEAEINTARQVYVPVAEEGAMLFFMVSQLSAIQHMYQYSLDQFMIFFFKSIREAPEHEKIESRVSALRETLRFVVNQWVSRGLFEDHKLVLLAQLTFQLAARGKIDAEFDPALFRFLVTPEKRVGDSKPTELQWLPDTAWSCVQALANMEDSEFAKLPSDLEEASGRFREWFNHVTPETEKLPLDWSALDKAPFKKLVVLRCMRPDRLTVAMNHFVASTLPRGREFTECDATMNSLQILDQTYKDSLPSTPIYFILSPGADVVSDLDQLAQSYGMEKGVAYHNVSMGQGQDKPAEEKLQLAHKQGHWVLLNNVHLMPRWLTRLEKILDSFAQDNGGEGSHENFRLFLTSDPAPTIPIGILNRSIKLSNEPPTGLKANLKRAITSFKPEYINEMDSKMRAILFGLCYFHAIMIERKKFGAKGFNMMYPFSLGDLRDSAVCLQNYMENASSKIPWEDLRYIFGQIMYGGHIVNDFDRLLCMTYLEFFMRDELLDEMELFPFNRDEKDASFVSPSPTTYERYLEHIEERLRGDTPIAFGLHPNAEIGFRTDQSERMFQLLQELQPRDSSAGEGEKSPREEAHNQLQDIKDQFGEVSYDLEEIGTSIDEGGGRGPFQNVLMLELEQMNRLLTVMRRTLDELELGFSGRLTMSDAMDKLEESLVLKRVPPQWAAQAWPSLRSLPDWKNDLARRVAQLSEWAANPTEVPRVTWLSGMINPQSFLTAIRQQTAQRTGQELDKLMIQTEVTKKYEDEIDAPSTDGAYVCGLYLQGARWDVSGGFVDKSRPREMHFYMPVINCRSIHVDRAEKKGVYDCPVYKTEQRGPTYVFSAQLRSKSPAARWIMAGVAVIMDVGE